MTVEHVIPNAWVNAILNVYITAQVTAMVMLALFTGNLIFL